MLLGYTKKTTVYQPCIEAKIEQSTSSFKENLKLKMIKPLSEASGIFK